MTPHTGERTSCHYTHLLLAAAGPAFLYRLCCVSSDCPDAPAHPVQHISSANEGEQSDAFGHSSHPVREAVETQVVLCTGLVSCTKRKRI